MIPHPAQHALKQLSLALAVLGFCAGLLLSYSVLAGDIEGRVNLLFLLLLFAFLPVAGLLLSLLLMLKGGGKGLAGLIFAIPLWPRHLSLALSRLGSLRSGNLWLFYQTQILSLGFSCGCLLLYLLLLLGTDITFVWRSTLLEPADLLPTLQVLALPWRFWPEAQPSLALVEISRDFRIGLQGGAQEIGHPAVGLWWQYILAAQICYNLLPRSVMLVVARMVYKRRMQAASSGTAADANRVNAAPAAQVELADVVSIVTNPYMLLDWAAAPELCHEQIQRRLGPAADIQQIAPVPVQEEINPDSSHSIVVLVKSWEPPLGELADRLREMQGHFDLLLLPLDWNAQGILPPAPAHLDEWRRFAATLPNWRVLQLQLLQQSQDGP